MRITKSSCKESELSRKWKRKPIEEKLSQSDFLFQNELQILSKISEKYFCFSVLLSLLFWRDPLNKPVQRSFSSDADFHVLFCLSSFYSVAHHISNKNSSRNNTFSTAAMTKKIAPVWICCLYRLTPCSLCFCLLHQLYSITTANMKRVARKWKKLNV